MSILPIPACSRSRDEPYFKSAAGHHERGRRPVDGPSDAEGDRRREEAQRAQERGGQPGRAGEHRRLASLLDAITECAQAGEHRVVQRIVHCRRVVVSGRGRSDLAGVVRLVGRGDGVGARTGGLRGVRSRSLEQKIGNLGSTYFSLLDEEAYDSLCYQGIGGRSILRFGWHVKIRSDFGNAVFM